MEIVQIAVAHATSLNRNSEALRLKGNFSLIGKLEGALIIDGDVKTIEGNVAPSLTVNGNVENLGVGPFWADEHSVDGEREAKLVITGNLKGYKTYTENPNLVVEIGGNVTTKGAFLYRTNIFRKMTIHGDLLTEEAICPGFYEGQLIVLGKALRLERYLNYDHRRSSAHRLSLEHYYDASFKGSSIIVGERQLTSHGVTPHQRQWLDDHMLGPCRWQ